MLGKNLAGDNNILGARYVKDPEAFIKKNEKRFAATPVFLQDTVPRGRYAHIGNGIWLRRCSGCDDFTLSYGTIAYLYEHGSHEASHGGLVAGFNSPVLPV